MPSLLSILGQAAIPAAEARGAYRAGQTEQSRYNTAGKRQSLLDQMQASLAKSQMGEADARTKYYDSEAANNWSENTLGDLYNRRTGEVHRGSGRPAVPHGEEHYDPGQDAMGITMVGPDGATFRKTRDATMVDRAHYQHEGDFKNPNTPAPEAPDVAAERSYNAKKRAADDLVSSFLANHDASDLTADALQTFAGHVLAPEERAALGRVRMPPSSERTLDIPSTKPPTSPTIPVAPGVKAKPGIKPPTATFEPTSTFAKKARGDTTGDQDEIDKAALRKAHPDYNEAQVTDLLTSIRSGSAKPPI